MADLSALLGQGGGFRPDARFAALPDGEEVMPVAVSALRAAMGAPFRRAHHALAPEPAPPPEPEEPAPDPVALARAEAYAQGAADARAACEAEAAQADQRRAKLALTFQRLDGELAEQFRQRLMDTVVTLCEATLLPLALDRAALARRVERAMAMFVRADDERTIRLHPDDIALVRPLLPEDWPLLPDPALERGAIRLENRKDGTEDGGVEDGPAQWRRAIADALDLGGGE